MALPMNFKPLLSAAIKTQNDFQKLRYPLIGSPKVDGIRVLTDITPLSRKLKPIPNKLFRRQIESLLLSGLDGEVTLGTETDVTSPNIFNQTQSALMSEAPELNHEVFTYWLFDIFQPHNLPYIERLKYVQALFDKELLPITGIVQFRLLGYQLLHNQDDLRVYEQECLEAGYEGIMLRNPQAKYKFNRSTLLENTLVKLKREEHGDVQHDEAQIISFEELQHNDNPALKDNLGYTKRTTHKANKRPGNTLGRFVCKVVTGRFAGVEVRIGTGNGLTHALRKTIWDNQQEYLHKYITFSHQLRGALDAPRFPVFQRFRAEQDVLTQS